MKRHALTRCYLSLCRWAGPVVLWVVLLLMRIIWGWQFHIAGMEKIKDIPKITGIFKNLHIPRPGVNAWVVAIAESVGGLLLLAGLGSRAAALVLTITMIVAYLTAHWQKNTLPLFKEGDVSAFVSATPFWFLATSVLVLALGPGKFSIDALLKHFFFKADAHLDEARLLKP